MNFLTSSTFWTAVSAIGTLLAIVVSLYLANRTKRKTKIVVKSIYTTPLIDCDKPFKVIITILNLGDVPIIIDECGIFEADDSLDTTYNKYIVDQNYVGTIVHVGEATKIEYNFGNSFDKNNPHGHNLIFKKMATFAIRDTTNNIYYK